jgi:hypothetical protein
MKHTPLQVSKAATQERKDHHCLLGGREFDLGEHEQCSCLLCRNKIEQIQTHIHHLDERSILITIANKSGPCRSRLRDLVVYD